LVASKKYPLQAAQRKMLEAVQEKIEEARGSDPWRYKARLSVDQVGTIGEEIGLEELDAVEMFHRLWQEEFFVAAGKDQRATVGLGQHLPFGVIISVERLTTKGLREIGKLPDPGEKLINAFEAATIGVSMVGRVVTAPSRPNISVGVVDWVSRSPR
jgi:hypothetical protein